MNWDMLIGRGWGPDYGDPKTYVDALTQIVETCQLIKGLNWTGSEVGNDAAAKEAIGLYEFQALKDAADAVVDDNDKRFELYAKAEAFLLDNAIFIPYCSMWRIQ